MSVLGFAHAERGPAEFFHAQIAGGDSLANVGVGAVIGLVPVALFAYNGYGAAIYYVEETKNAAKTIGRVIVVCLVVTVAVEIIPLAAVVIGAPSMTDLLNSEAPMNYFLVERGGATLNIVISVGIAIAIINAVIAIILQVARQLFASARDKSWPEPVDLGPATVHPKLHTPVAATLVVGALAALAAVFIPIEWLITATGASVVAIYLAVAIAALRLRRPGCTVHCRLPHATVAAPARGRHRVDGLRHLPISGLGAEPVGRRNRDDRGSGRLLLRLHPSTPR